MSYSVKSTRRLLPLYYLALPLTAVLLWLLPFRWLLFDLRLWFLLPLWIVGGHLACGLSCLITSRSPRYAVLLLRSSLYAYGREASVVHLQAALAVALAEEMLFRYALLGWLGQQLGPLSALLLSSALFALLHLRPGARLKNLPQLVDLLLLGLLLGGVTLATGSLYPALLMHALRNYILRCLLISREEYAERNQGSGVRDQGSGDLLGPRR